MRCGISTLESGPTHSSFHLPLLLLSWHPWRTGVPDPACQPCTPALSCRLNSSALPEDLPWSPSSKPYPQALPQSFSHLESIRPNPPPQVLKYFSYEHFYVIYCKFWELDTDHDFFIDSNDLAHYSQGALSYQIIERVFEEVGGSFQTGAFAGPGRVQEMQGGSKVLGLDAGNSKGGVMCSEDDASPSLKCLCLLPCWTPTAGSLPRSRAASRARSQARCHMRTLFGSSSAKRTRQATLH